MVNVSCSVLRGLEICYDKNFFSEETEKAAVDPKKLLENILEEERLTKKSFWHETEPPSAASCPPNPQQEDSFVRSPQQKLEMRKKVSLSLLASPPALLVLLAFSFGMKPIFLGTRGKEKAGPEGDGENNGGAIQRKKERAGSLQNEL